MRTLGPRRSHPLLWALTDIVGLQLKTILEETEISKFFLTRYLDGYEPSPEHVKMLHALLTDCTTRMVHHSPPVEKQHPVIRSYYRTTYTVINHILESFSQLPLPKKTDLSQALLSVLSNRSMRRSEAISLLKPHHSAQAIRRCAQRIKVVETWLNGVCYWARPPGVESPIKFVPSPPKEPTSKTEARLQDLIRLYLKNGPRKSRDLAKFLYNRGFRSRTQIYKASVNMRLIRERIGYGPQAHSLWSLPKRLPNQGQDLYIRVCPDDCPDNKASWCHLHRPRVTK